MDVRITDNALIFQSVIRKSVPTIPKNIYRFVDRICKKHGLSVQNVTGNFEVIRFELDQYISEEQAIDISNWIRQDSNE
jgi:hypothetical protein